MAKQQPILISEDQLLDPLIPVETVNKLIYEGNVEKLLILLENPKFSEISEETMIAMSKLRIIWYKNTEIQIGAVMFLIICSLIIQLDWKFVNFSLFTIMIFLFLRLKSYSKMKKNSESERLLYIENILKGSEYSISHLIEKSHK